MIWSIYIASDTICEYLYRRDITNLYIGNIYCFHIVPHTESRRLPLQEGFLLDDWICRNKYG